MKHNLKKLGALIAGSLAMDLSTANALDDNSVQILTLDSMGLNGIEVGVLNSSMPLYLAGHRSHSSHKSHSSHRSSSGGSSYPIKTYPSTPKTPSSNPLGQPVKPKSSYPIDTKVSKLQSAMTDETKRKNIIMRVQLTLQTLGFYEGAVDGMMGPATRKSVNKYRSHRGLKQHEKLDVNTLNSLSIMSY